MQRICSVGGAGDLSEANHDAGIVLDLFLFGRWSPPIYLSDSQPRMDRVISDLSLHAGQTSVNYYVLGPRGPLASSIFGIPIGLQLSVQLRREPPGALKVLRHTAASLRYGKMALAVEAESVVV